MKRLLSVLVVLGAAACSSPPPERPIIKVEGNVMFRLGAKPDGVEIRVESSFYPSSGYELMARIEGVAPSLTAGITIVLDGVRVPLEATGDRAPATAVLFVPAGAVDGFKWPLVFKLPIAVDAFRTDAYAVRHDPAGWRLSTEQGGFSRYEAQGSY